MSKNIQYDYAVFIGRFEPPHIGHVDVIEQALKIADKLIIIVGSANLPATFKNPWNFETRKDLILRSLDEPLRKRVTVVPQSDIAYNDQLWVSNLQNLVADHTEKGSKIALVGHTKDDSSYYLKLFPQWKYVEYDLNEEVNATDIRTILFERRNLAYLKGVVTPFVYDFLRSYCISDEYEKMVKEYEHIIKYKKAWDAAPYPVTFVTVDACVIQSGHVLLVERKAEPGLGLFALPGGFLEQNEYILDGCIRELREETKLKVPEPVLKGSVKDVHVFDKPDRSARGRTITHAHLIVLNGDTLPPVKGSDDAKYAMWVPFNEIKAENMFEDHWSMIQYFLGKL